MNKIIVILGPTNVGKTKLSIALAKKFNGEIINADSVQFYRGLDIGSFKVSKSEMDNVKHYLIDNLSVLDNYSIYDYQKDGRYIIDKIISSGKIPIIVGGSALYIRALLYDYKLNSNKINNNYDDLTNSQLYDKLIKLDKDIVIDKNNRPRLKRAVNYYLETNSSISKNVTNKLLYDVIFIGLTANRDILYDKINKRVDDMINRGLVDEVKSLYKYKDKSRILNTAIGYKEIISYLDNDITLDTAVYEIKKNSRRFAKRQMTFFKNKFDVKWFNCNYDNFDNTINSVINYIGGIL